jgi:23S rRNA pseudouridine2457 synthase
VGYPTLRLVRTRIGDWSVAGLQPGDYRELEVHLPTARPVAPTGRTRRRRN